jgi:hypothetical protein
MVFLWFNMLPIQDSRVFTTNGKWAAACVCGKTSSYSSKNSCLRMLERGVCSYCKPDYRNVNDGEFEIYRRLDGKWCSTCPSCGIEQAYTRKDHAKQSSLNSWRCKKCNSNDKVFNANCPVGNEQRIFNKFKKSAKTRGITWDLSIDDMFKSFNGKCALTGWDISIEFKNENASLDRINSEKAYTSDNIQWVHSMVNMCKNKYNQEKFVEMCVCIANKVKW